MFRFIRIVVEKYSQLAFGDFLALLKLALFREGHILVYALDTSQVDLKENASNDILTRKGNIKEIDETARLSKHVPWEFRCHQYDKVTDFFVAGKGEGIQHISWIYYQNDPNRLIRLSPHDAEIKYCLTLEPYRGRGLYPNVLKAIVRYLGQMSFRRVFICVDEGNKASLRGIEKAGFRRVGQVHLRKIMGFQVSSRYSPSET